MQGKQIVISILICALTISLGIVFSVGAKEEPDPDGLFGSVLSTAAILGTEEEESTELTHEELVEKVRAQERRIIRLELIVDKFKALGKELNDPMFETEIKKEVDKLVDAEPEKANIVGTGILIGALILLVVGIAVLTIRLSRR